MKSKAIEQYRKSGELGQPDVKTMLLCYDRILEAAASHEATAVERGITLLEESIHYDPNPMLGFHLLRLYQYLRHCLKQEQYGEICRVTESLKNLWVAGIEADKLNLEPLVHTQPGDETQDVAPPADAES